MKAKALTASAAALLLIIAVVIGLRLAGTDSAKNTASAAKLSPQAPTHITRDPTDIFQRAFWRHPTEADHILHAERHEWENETGLQRWAWYIVLQPSPELITHLRQTNPFQLQANSVPLSGLPATPDWFQPPSDSEHLSRTDLHLLFTPGDQLLYATASGQGFMPPVTAKP
jgi:hypothetical protein